MSEQEQNSQLSALFDNELPPEQAEFVIRRAVKDPALRTSWGRYALIGACLRNEPIHANLRQPDVAERVRMALAGEAEHPLQSDVATAVAGNQRKGWSLFGRGALGGAIAAGVAVLSLFVMNSMGPQAMPDAAIQTAQAGTAAAAGLDSQPAAEVSRVDAPVLMAANDSPAPSYTTPVDNSPARVSGQMANLVVAHSQVAASAMRIIPLSAYDITGAVDMTEAEIGAYR